MTMLLRPLLSQGRAIRLCVLCLCAAGVVLTGCATSKELQQKSEGYYQEGIASLATDRQKAFVSFQKAIQMDPENKDAHYALGHVYASQGKLADAERSFRSAIAVDDTYSEAHNYLGQVLASQNRWEEAIKEYRQSLSNPLYATPDKARFNLGMALAHEGKLQLAMEMFEDALTVNPPNVPPALTYLELGKVCYKLGYHTRAREVLSKVATMEKGGELARAAAELLAQLK
ncbi:MAG: tetratricopeptide repeat protein [Nitrospiraceae bacterium]